nr:integrase, catalytic region, zinc finger, CCHC-type, peptidase aspartic, catalytic [Tanacetum cinerariifolium]
MHGVQVQLVMRELRTELGMQIQEHGVALDEEQLLFIVGGKNNVVDEDVDEQPVQDLALVMIMKSTLKTRMQLNSKFVNNMLPEWGRFVTVVKLNRGLRDSNYDQLYAYLKQHEAHANENKMMLDRFTQNTIDPLGTKLRFKTAWLLFKMFRVDKIEARGTMHGVQVQLVMEELRTELGMQIQVKKNNVVDEDVDEQLVQDLALVMIMKSTLKTRSPRVLSSIAAFCSCVLVSAIWFCVLVLRFAD